MSRADDIAQAFYEDPDLRGSLTDDEADVLLKWASEQAARLDASGADDAAFQALADQLRKLVKQINRYAGEGLYTPPVEQAEALTVIAEQAEDIGLVTTPVFSAQAAPSDPMAALTGLLASFSPTEGTVPSPVKPTPEEVETTPPTTTEPIPPMPVESEPTEPASHPAPSDFDEDVHDF
ncbi:MAG: hypothetical protein U0452_06285 [Anaerolineae bacterium]